MSTIPNFTPQQINELSSQKDQQTSIRQQATSLIQSNSDSIINNIPPNLAPTGAAKLAILLNKKSSEIETEIISRITELAGKTGIKNIGTPQMILPDYCLESNQLTNLIEIRNNLVDKLNRTVDTLNRFSQILTGFNSITDAVKAALNGITLAQQAVSTGISFIPSPPGTPGAIVSSLVKLKDIKDFTSPLYSKALGSVSIISLSLSNLRNSLIKTINILKDLDLYFKKCSPNSSLNSLDNTLIELEKLNQQEEEDLNITSYNGFILEIVEEPYSPTINRRKAVAKNNQGIILLSTPLSFTTDNQILINQIKLLIESNNLKAY